MTALRNCGKGWRRCAPVGPRASLHAAPPPPLLHHGSGRQHSSLDPRNRGETPGKIPSSHHTLCHHPRGGYGLLAGVTEREIVIRERIRNLVVFVSRHSQTIGKLRRMIDVGSSPDDFPGELCAFARTTNKEWPDVLPPLRIHVLGDGAFAPRGPQNPGRSLVRAILAERQAE